MYKSKLSCKFRKAYFSLVTISINLRLTSDRFGFSLRYYIFDLFLHPVRVIGRRGFPVDNLVCEFACLNDDLPLTTNGNTFLSPTHSIYYLHILDKMHFTQSRGGGALGFFAYFLILRKSS